MSKRILDYLGLPEKYHGISTIWLLSLAIIIAIMMNSCGGCDCDCCESDITVTPGRKSGSAVLEVRNLTPLFSSSPSITVSFSGNVIAESEGTGRNSFAITKGYDTPQDVVMQDRSDLRPGTWEMRVSVGNWSASCQGNIQQNRGTRFIFTYGSGGCVVQ